ncbi:MAG: DNA-3-methyladenine glycosylase [Fimbriimonadaceae bacterium]|nr:DNA-3-methyladenine glycosylase [Fimbriimonadaceae bacterium]
MRLRVFQAPMNTEILKILADDVCEGAIHLLGATLRWGDLAAEVVETEAYRGGDDRACHATLFPNMRNRVMHGPPGFAYVYFTYGNHFMLNVSALPDGQAGAILIRAARPISGLAEMHARRAVKPAKRPRTDRDLLSGPGKLAQAFGIRAAQNGQFLFDGDGLHLEVAEPLVRPPHRVGTRIGISAGNCEDWPWRFIADANADWASRPHLPPTDHGPSR